MNSNGHRTKGRQALVFPNTQEISAEDAERMVAILDRMLDLALSLNWPADRKEFHALQEQLAHLTGLPMTNPTDAA